MNKTMQQYHNAILKLTGRPPDRSIPRYRGDKDYRSTLVRQYAWSVPSQEAIDKIVQFASLIVEIGAGTGFWAACLQEAGAAVHPYDLHPPTKGDNPYGHTTAWTTIGQGDARVLEAYEPNWALLLSWPPYNEPLELDALKAFRGNKLIYIGEGDYGCTGTEEGKDYRSEHFEYQDEISIPGFASSYDSVQLWHRKKGESK
jgi:hypothetical protein